MTGPTTFSEAWDMPSTDVLNRYQVLENRDTMSRAIATLLVRGEWNDDRSPDPDDYPPLTTAEHLEMLALGEAIARHSRHPSQVHHTVIAGATWEQIAAATGGDPGQARQAYQEWAEGQHQLQQDFPAASSACATTSTPPRSRPPTQRAGRRTCGEDPPACHRGRVPRGRRAPDRRRRGAGRLGALPRPRGVGARPRVRRGADRAARARHQHHRAAACWITTPPSCSWPPIATTAPPGRCSKRKRWKRRPGSFLV